MLPFPFLGQVVYLGLLLCTEFHSGVEDLFRYNMFTQSPVNDRKIEPSDESSGYFDL